MSWFNDDKRTLVERLCINVLKCGAIPSHIAVIMDGNRRYAKHNSLPNVMTGHVHGFDKLTQTLSWCNDLGINQVTVYTFAIENFKRPQEEVDSLMDLAREKFNKLFQEKDEFMKRGVCFRVFGNISLLPSDIQKSIAKIVLLTQNNDKAFLNMCFAYASREEMSNAIRELADGVNKNLLLPSDINEHLLDQCLYSTNVTDPDLLIRTSGEVRLSDFLLWQVGYSVIAFPNVLWPDFTIWDLFSAIFYYQRNCDAVKNAKLSYLKEQQLIEDKLTEQLFQDQTDECDIKEFREKRNRRIEQFINYIKDKRIDYLEAIARD